MHWNRVLFLVAVGVLSINARAVKRQKRIRQRQACAPSCRPPVVEIPCGLNSILEPTYGSIGTCNCQSMFLDELPNYKCGCQYIESYGIMDREMSNYGRVIKLPKMIPNCDAGATMAAISLPGLYDLVVGLPGRQEMSYVADLPVLPSCQCQLNKPYQFIDSPCNCRSKQTLFEYLSPFETLPSPLLKVPYAEPYNIQPPKCQPQAIQLPAYSCQNMPCNSDNGIKMSYGLPCGCQKSCECQSPLPYGLQLPVDLPCACQKSCECQSLLPYGLQLPMDLPCACQASCQCQLAPVELPVAGYGCQELPPPVIGCGGKYLRQVTLQPPFL